MQKTRSINGFDITLVAMIRQPIMLGLLVLCQVFFFGRFILADVTDIPHPIMNGLNVHVKFILSRCLKVTKIAVISNAFVFGKYVTFQKSFLCGLIITFRTVISLAVMLGFFVKFQDICVTSTIATDVTRVSLILMLFLCVAFETVLVNCLVITKGTRIP